MKYEPLETFLRAQTADAVPLTFSEVERILQAELPPSARKHPAWWSNNSTGHVNALAWLGAGFKAEQLDLSAGKLVFRRQSAPAIPASHAGVVPSQPGFLDRIRARLAGTVTVMPGVDLTAPMDEVWDAER